MALKHHLADASYWLYDRGRHRTAFTAAAEPGTASDFSGLDGQEYAVLVTFRRDGTAVPTPVWFALLHDRRFVTATEERTAKVRRIRQNPRVRVFPSDPRGKPLAAGVEGTARILEAAGERGCRRGGPRPALRPQAAHLREGDDLPERHGLPRGDRGRRAG